MKSHIRRRRRDFSSCGLIILAFCLLCILAAAAPEPEFFDVFIAGKDGINSIRIPSAVVTSKGTLLVFAEGHAVHADQADNKLILYSVLTALPDGADRLVFARFTLEWLTDRNDPRIAQQ